MHELGDQAFSAIFLEPSCFMGYTCLCEAQLQCFLGLGSFISLVRSCNDNDRKFSSSQFFSAASYVIGYLWWHSSTRLCATVLYKKTDSFHASIRTKNVNFCKVIERTGYFATPLLRSIALQPRELQDWGSRFFSCFWTIIGDCQHFSPEKVWKVSILRCIGSKPKFVGSTFLHFCFSTVCGTYRDMFAGWNWEDSGLQIRRRELRVLILLFDFIR